MRLFTYVCAFLLVSTAAFAQGRGNVPTVSNEIIGRPVGYDTFDPTAINNKGEVVGFAQLLEGGYITRIDAFLWSRPTGFTLIASDATAQDINERGEIALAHWDCANDELRCYFRGGALWRSGGELIDLGQMYPLAINNRGDIAGHCPGPFHDPNPIWFDGSACAIRGGIFVEWSCRADERYEACGQIATDINERGDIVGQRFTTDDTFAAVMFPWQGGEVLLAPLMSAAGINNRGTVVGNELVGSYPAAVMWTKGRPRRLPGGNVAIAINARGWVLGYQYSGGTLLWTSPSEPPLYLKVSAAAMNDRGQLVGTSGSQMVISTVHP